MSAAQKLLALASCPFCGDSASVMRGGVGLYVHCNGKGCWCVLGEISTQGETDGIFETAEAAAAAWNQRATG